MDIKLMVECPYGEHGIPKDAKCPVCNAFNRFDEEPISLIHNKIELSEFVEFVAERLCAEAPQWTNWWSGIPIKEDKE